MGGVLRIADLLQYVPMLYGLAVSVHLEDVNAGNPTVLLLAEIYGWFTEGFDTADLKDAKALLGELNG